MSGALWLVILLISVLTATNDKGEVAIVGGFVTAVFLFPPLFIITVVVIRLYDYFGNDQ